MMLSIEKDEQPVSKSLDYATNAVRLQKYLMRKGRSVSRFHLHKEATKIVCRIPTSNKRFVLRCYAYRVKTV
jgi:hypothetical protein